MRLFSQKYCVSLLFVITSDGARVYDSKPDEKVYTLVLTDIEGEMTIRYNKWHFYFLKNKKYFFEMLMVYIISYSQVVEVIALAWCFINLTTR